MIIRKINLRKEINKTPPPRESSLVPSSSNLETPPEFPKLNRLISNTTHSLINEDCRENPTHHDGDILHCISSPNPLLTFLPLFSDTAQSSTVSCRLVFHFLFCLGNIFVEVGLLDATFSFSIVCVCLYSDLIQLIREVLVNRSERVEIWSLRRLFEWRPCNWWLQGHPAGWLSLLCFSHGVFYGFGLS